VKKRNLPLDREWISNIQKHIEASTLLPRLFVTLSYANDKFEEGKLIGDAIKFQRKLSRLVKGAHIQLYAAAGTIDCRKHIHAVISSDKAVPAEIIALAWTRGNVDVQVYSTFGRTVMYTYEHDTPLNIALECPKRTSGCKRGNCRVRKTRAMPSTRNHSKVVYSLVKMMGKSILV